jgi:hypothetical protein
MASIIKYHFLSKNASSHVYKLYDDLNLNEIDFIPKMTTFSVSISLGCSYEAFIAVMMILWDLKTPRL